MYVSYPARFETFGAVKIYELTKVRELFAFGSEVKPGVFTVPSLRELEDIAFSTAFIVPVKNEEPLTLEGVLRAIPHHSPVILVSNSSIYPLNMYRIETDIVKMIYKVTGKTMVVVHQKDKVIAEKLKSALPEIIDEKESVVRDGKGEAMLIGTLIADGLGAENVAFVDADNYVPGVVLEYALMYYTVLGSSESKYKMVRVAWGHKAWFAEELYLRRSGRVSAIINSVFNRVLSARKRVETDIVKTANSGEHAMSIELARLVDYGGGFSIETSELVSILEKCYLGVDRGLCPVLPESIDIYQVESLSPHIHAEKGEAHVINMILESLSTIYYSQLPDNGGKTHILSVLRDLGFLGEPVLIPKYKYPDINVKEFVDTVVSESELCTALGL